MFTTSYRTVLKLKPDEARKLVSAALATLTEIQGDTRAPAAARVEAAKAILEHAMPSLPKSGEAGAEGEG